MILNILTSCSMQKTKGVSLEQALSMAGENQAELEKVLEYYKNDSLKLEAARFLIRNMPFHFSRMEYFVSPEGERYVPDIRNFTDNQAVKRHCDSLQEKGYTIRKEIVYDIKALHSDYLIRNIDLAFQVWQKPWARAVSWNDFCRFVLPYRSQTEPASNSRETFMCQYMPLLDSSWAQTPLEASMIINEQLSKEIRYQKAGSPLVNTIEETGRFGIGTCEALCNYTTFVMRAVGIPIAVHQTTWTRMAFIHNWCAVPHNGIFHDFSPGEAHSHDYADKLATAYFLQPAKVYRRHFDADLSILPEQDDGYITLLKSPLFTDVTDEQKLPTYTLHVPIDKKTTEKSGLVYLCTYNDRDWQPIAIGTRENDCCQFDRVAGRNFLIVAEAIGKNELRYISEPFQTDGEGGIRLLKPDFSQVTSVTCRQEAERRIFPLSFWDTERGQFVPLDCKCQTDSTQYYDNIPVNALLLHTFEDKNGVWKETGLAIDGYFKRNKDI
ncbi:transglutaminase-like domain-containing protein [Parabacteroides hominis]|nr:transglutaminase-like domain-containing protein [Parabacteroides hominis]